MKQWVYKIVEVNGEIKEALLNEYGADGWELVGIEPNHDYTYYYQLVFKQERKEQTNDND